MHSCIRISHLERRGAGLFDQAAVNTPPCLFCVHPRDPNPKMERLYNSGRDDHMLRVQNFSILNRHLRAFYQVGEGHGRDKGEVEELDQIIRREIRRDVLRIIRAGSRTSNGGHPLNVQVVSLFKHCRAFCLCAMQCNDRLSGFY